MLAYDRHATQKQDSYRLSIETRHPLKEKINEFPKKKFRKGDIIYTPEENAKEILFLHEGRVKVVSYSAEGKELIKKLFGKGEFFGEEALLQGRQRHNFAIANTGATLGLIPVNELWEMMKQDPDVNIFFLGLFSRQLMDLENRLESIVFQSSRARILRYLVELVEQKGDRVGFEWVVRRFMSHQDIANITATSRQTVNSVLNDLRRDEVITFNRRRLLVRDLDQLREISRKVE